MKRKKCKMEGCKSPSFSSGLCKYHKAREKLDSNNLLSLTESVREKDHNFYLQIWKERPHTCVSCKSKIYGEPSTMYFDHLIEKKGHPELRYEKRNIVIVCGDCHDMKTRGLPTKEHLTLIKEAEVLFLQ